MRVSAIVAYDEGGIIGRDGGLPWHLPSDLKRFKALTMGKPIIMGRRTWDSIGRPLPGRTSIVVTRERGRVIEGATVVHDLDAALSAAKATGAEEAVIIGGAQIYAEALPRCARIYATEVHARVDGDATFPPLHAETWAVTHEEAVPADERNAYAHTYRVFERRG
jgi:dihydrofolate reductase